ncbi:MAG TPA: putative Ig domain-containing protein [Cellvibrio sp.]|nr:putative Ig domain-containing protein [Cellvibrio sp.]
MAQAAEQLDLLSVYQPDDALASVASASVEPVDDSDDTTAQADIVFSDDHAITTLVFVDTRVDNYEVLVNDIQERVDASSVAIIYLDSGSDGLAQISEYLAGFTGISAIHVISHGVAGNLQLGNQVLNETNLAQFKGQLAGWQTGLTPDADILLYGCELAANQSGLNLLQQLSDFTGADVAASNDLTGNSRADADWELEARIGQIEAASIFSSDQNMQWQGVLADLYHLNSGPPTNEERIPAAGHIKQGVQLTTSQTIDRVQITLANHGTVSSDVVMTIRQSSYDGPVVATSSIKTNSLGSSLGQVNFDFNAVTLTAYYVYWIDFRTNDGADNLVGLGYINQNVISGEFVLNFAGDSSRDMSIALIDAGNRAPAVVTPIPDRTTTEGVQFTYTVPANTFNDLDGDPLTYSARLANGGALPAWLTFNPTTRTFSGQADDGDVGSMNIRVFATDTSGQSIFDEFNLNVTNLAEPPFVANPIPDQAAQGFVPFSYQFPTNTFGDPEGNVINSYRVTLADGSALPGWLSFDSASRTFSGTPTNADAGTIAIRVYATDSTGLESTAPDQFNLVVTASVNDAPVNTVPGAQSTNEDTALVFNLANGNRIQISDPDAWSSSVRVSLSVSNGLLTLGGTAGLSFATGDGTNDSTLVFTGTIANINAALASLTYTPSANYNGTDTLSIVTNDLGNSGTGGAKSDSDTVAITVNAVNDAPINSVPGSTQVGTEDIAFVFSAGRGNQIQINDIDSGSGDLQVSLAVTNGTLTLAGTTGLIFTTGDGAADGSMVFTGTRAAINTALATLTFNPTANYTGSAVLSLTTSDLGNTGSGGIKTDSDTVNITLAPVNDAPTVANPIPDQNATEDLPFSFQFASNTFNDIDASTTLVYSTSALPSWLSFNAATRTFSGTPLNAHVGPVSITVTASDGALSVSDTFVITVANTNDAPVVANLIPNQNATEDSPFSFQFASNTFMDPDPGVPNLTYTATLGNNSALPGWLSFDAATRTFSGTPLNANVGTISVKVTASDPSGAVAFDIFDITVANTNDAPVVANPIADQNATEDQPFSFTFASNTFVDPDPGSTTLTYAAQLAGGGALPAWLTFNSATRSFSGTPTNGDTDVTIEVIASDGALSVSDTFAITITNVPDAPYLAIPISDQSATEEAPFTFALPGGTFIDPDGDSLTYTATMADGSPLTWLVFDPDTQTFTGTPGNSHVGINAIRVIADDGTSPPAIGTFDILVANTNDAPTVATPIGDQIATEDSPFNFTFGAGTFVDQDAGDSLSYTTGVLPAWLSFDPATRTFSGTPSNDDVTPVGSPIPISVIATDLSGASVVETFSITVINTNDVPIADLVIADQPATQDVAFSFQFDAATFSDADNDPLTYSASLVGGAALPAWLSFDSATRTFSGTPGNDDVGTLEIVVTANDGNGGVATTSFDIVVSDTNDAPAVVIIPTDYEALEQTTIDLHGTGIVVADIDGDSLTVTMTGSYTNSNLAATAGTTGVNISGVNTNTLTLTGTVAQLNDLFAGNNGGTLTYRLSGNTPVATDLLTISVSDGNLTGSDTAAINITAVNDGPTNIVPGAQSTNEDTALVFSAGNGNQIQVDDLDVGSADLEVTLSVTSGRLTLAHVVGLSFTRGSGVDDTTLVFRGTQAAINSALATLTYAPASNFNGTAVLTITTSDLGNTGIGGTLTDSENIDITVNAVNDAPNVASPIPDRIAIEDTAFVFQFGAGVFADVDGNPLTYMAQLPGGGLPTWLSFDPLTRTFSGTPANSDVGQVTINVIATDGSGASVTDSFIITVANTNDAPTVTNAIPDRNALEDTPFTFQFASNTFTDVDATDVLTYSARLADGNALPGWLSFDPATRTFTGTPANNDVGTISITVTASDGKGGSIADTFDVVIANTNDAPNLANSIPDQVASEDAPFSFQFAANSFADVDGNSLTYSARLSDGNVLPAWLSFDAVTRTFSGTPANADVGTLSIMVTANDGNGGTVTDTFNLAVINTNDAPVLANPIANQTATEHAPFRFILPANTFVDADGDTLVYSAQLAGGGALPAWLSFDAATRTFSGTPANGDVGVIAIDVIASDSDGAAVYDTFNITVVNTNDAPVSVGFAPVNNREDAAGDTVDLWAGFSDPESAPNQMQYSLVSNSNSALVSSAVIDPATGKLQLAYGAHQFGSSDLVIRAQDPQGAWVDTALRVNIESVNDVPTSAGIADVQVAAGAVPQQTNLRTVFSDIEQGAQLQYVLQGNSNPAIVPQVLLDSATGTMTLSFASLVGGESVITLRALDAEGAWVETQFKVTVTAAVIEIPVMPPGPDTSSPTTPPTLPPIETPVLTPPEVNPPGMGGGTGGGGDDPSAPTNPGDMNPVVPVASISLSDMNGDGYDRDLQGKSSLDYQRAEDLLAQRDIASMTLAPTTALESLITPDAGFAPWEAAEFDSEVRRMRAQMDEAMDEEQERKAVVAGLTFSVTTGILIWALRASTLLLTMMSMLPLWRGFDPLPILDEVDKKKKELEQQRKDREREDKNAKEVGYLFDHAQNKKSRP